tara:strand:- start:154 stop:447 length:294 start_codon:yes stop_codon:yes gene_type:complete
MSVPTNKKRKLSLEVLEKNIPQHLRYLVLVALNDFEDSHNLLSADMQRDLLNGDYKKSLSGLEKYLSSCLNLSESIAQVKTLLEKEIKTTKDPKPKK